MVGICWVTIIIIIIIIITAGLVGSSFEYSYTRLALRLRRSARSEIMTWGNDKTPSFLEPLNLHYLNHPAFQLKRESIIVKK